jgi:hypothetical protein
MKLAIVGIFLCVLGLAPGANSDDRRDDRGGNKGGGGRPARQMGVPVGHSHMIKNADGHEVTHAIIGDHRPLATIHNDRALIRAKVGFFPTGHVAHRWDHWHRDWGIYWRFADWHRINQVTCEAVNTSNNYLYPATGYRTDYPNAWSNDVANQVVEIALDDCYSDSQQNGSNPEDCVLIDWECRYL